MLDLNHILFFLAVVSPLAVLARAWRPGPVYRGWRVAAFIVLGIAGLSWLFVRSFAGFVAGGFWLALLFIPAIGMRRVADLATRQRFASARRLATVLWVVHPTGELRHQIEMLRTLETRPEMAAHRVWPSSQAGQRGRHWRNSPAVVIVILINLGVFLIEFVQMMRGHLPEWLVLHRLGAFEADEIIFAGQYWRLFTALFLHAGVAHLIFNLFALYVLGPPLERAIGTFRFCVCYLIAGLGSNLGVLWLGQHHLANAGQLVGASGCVMGIVGASAAFLVRNRHIPLAKQRLLNILMIVAIQTAFDLSTPQVSMAAHLCGLAVGFFAGLWLAPHKKMSI